VDGGIYLKGKNMKRLVGGEYRNGKDSEVVLPDELEPAILYTLVYQGREWFSPEVKSELSAPVEEIIDSNGDVVCEAAIIGEMAMPAHRVVNGTRFHTGKRNAYDWFWRDAYDSERSDQKLSDIYYRDTFIEEELD